MIASSRKVEILPSPLVSICIPTYNNAAMVVDALRSALAQSHDKLEIVVLDNHSTDATEEVVRRAAGVDPRVRYVRHAQNVGMAGNFNQALAQSRGELLLILCADDVLEPTCAAALASALSETPGAVLAACSRRIVDEHLEAVAVMRPRTRRQTVSGAALIVECFARGNILGEPSAVMFRRSAAGHGFSENYHQLLDLEMWFRLLAQGDAVCLPEVLSNIRRHASQWSNANLRSGRVIVDKRALFQEFAGRVGPSMSFAQKLRWDVRMASSVGRTRQTNGQKIDRVSEVFYPAAFPVLRGLATAAYATSAVVSRLRT